MGKKPRRASNQELAERFRDLLTNGAKEAMSPDTLAASKEYRSRLWKAFAEIEERLDPLLGLAKARERGERIEDDSN